MKFAQTWHRREKDENDPLYKYKPKLHGKNADDRYSLVHIPPRGQEVPY